MSSSLLDGSDGYFSDYYTHFIIGESMIEVYSRETTGVEQNVAMAKTKLSEAERHLKVVLKENGKVCMQFFLPTRT